MDWIELRQKAIDGVKKYRYVMLVLLAGLFLMMLPEGNDRQEADPPAETQAAEERPMDLQESLAEILSQIDGAGKVRVLLTQAAGETTIYQVDESISTKDGASNIQQEAVIISSSDRAESGLIQQVNPPVYLGAIVLCQGADSAAIRLAIVDAVANATGLSTDKISVLKMK